MHFNSIFSHGARLLARFTNSNYITEIREREREREKVARIIDVYCHNARKH
jgi:hypothetical protein